MPAYCIYLVGPNRQIVAEPVISQLASDAEAFIRAARMSSTDTGAEVWQGQRQVCQVPPKAAPRTLALAEPQVPR